MKHLKYKAMFGRYQPWHRGHRWLLMQLLRDTDYGVWIGVRDVTPDKDNLYAPKTVVANIKTEIAKALTPNEMERVRVEVIPDLEGVYYGRDVGYNIKELEPPSFISEVSGTKIREENEKTNPNPSSPPTNRFKSKKAVSDGSGKHIQRYADSGE